MQIKELNSRQIAAIVIIILALLLAVYMGVQSQVTYLETPNPVTVASATKLTYYNDGDQWVHQNVIFENVTCKNGSVQTFYVDMYIKPGSSITVDLSELFGYGTEKLPPGYEVNVMTWKELMSQSTTAPTGTLKMRVQGWSNTNNPQPYDRYYIIKYEGMEINQLPSSIVDNQIYKGFDINKLTLFLSGKYGAHDQVLLILDSDGRVRMIWKILPELCDVVIIDPFIIPMKTTT